MKTILKYMMLSLLIVGISACDNAANENDTPTFIVEGGGGEQFRVQITDPQMEKAADSLLANNVNKIVHGTLRRGDGGFNEPYGWHLDPSTITFPDLAIELCDGRPSKIDDDLDYWIDTVKIYCPWGAKIVDKEQGDKFKVQG